MTTKSRLISEMVSGDAGGNPDNIAAGTNSGAAVYPGPGSKKKKVKRMNEVLGFKAFMEGCSMAKKEKEKKDKEIKEAAEAVTSFSFKSFGANHIVVEATQTEIKSVEISGKTARDTVVEADLAEAYKEFGKEGVLSYVKEATKLVWKNV